MSFKLTSLSYCLSHDPLNFNLINAEEKRKLRKCKVFLNGKESGMIVDVTENAVFFCVTR